MRLPLLLNGPLLVTMELCASQSPAVTEGIEAAEIGDGAPFPGNELRESLVQVMAGERPNDGEAAIAVRSLLNISRRYAAEPTFWHYCSVVLCPEYVVWRWGDPGKPVPRNRYLGTWERNAIGRLWWLAELTLDQRRDNRFAPTLKAASNQEFSLWCLDSFLGANPAIIRALISVCFSDEGGLTGEQIRELFKRITAVRATRNLDLLREDDLLALVRTTAQQLRHASSAASGAK